MGKGLMFSIQRHNQREPAFHIIQSVSYPNYTHSSLSTNTYSASSALGGSGGFGGGGAALFFLLFPGIGARGIPPFIYGPRE